MNGLSYLDCSESHLASLDVTKNHVLTHLDCSDQEIPSLDVSNNPELTYLNCHNNLLTTLDLTNNTLLELLWCQENQLTSLDVSNSIALSCLACGDNLLTSLNVSNNLDLRLSYCGWEGDLNISGMPSLYEVCVWETFSLDSVDVDSTGSPNVCFQTDCNGDCTVEITLSVSIDTLYHPDNISATSSVNGIIYLVTGDTEKDISVIREVCIDSVEAIANTPVNIPLSGLDNGIYWLYARDSTGNISEPQAFTILGVGLKNYEADQLRIYPNPTNTLLTVETVTLDLCSIEVASLNGQLIYHKNMEGTIHQLDFSSFRKGVYFITIRSNDFVTTRKIIKL